MLEVGLKCVAYILGVRCDFVCGRVLDGGEVVLVAGSWLKTGRGFYIAVI